MRLFIGYKKLLAVKALHSTVEFQKEIVMFKHIFIPTDGSKLSQMAMQKAAQFAKEMGARGANGDNKICKVSAVGVGMRSHPGVASQMFSALANENINIQMISTSEIKISVVVDDKYLELAVRTLHSEFNMQNK